MTEDNSSTKALTELSAKLDTLIELTKLQNAWLERSYHYPQQANRWMVQLLEDFLPKTNQRYQDPLRLPTAQGQVFSQNNEDGVVAEIFRRIKPRHKTFLEIGVGNGMQNTSRLLLSQGWQGHWVEGDAASAKQIHDSFAPAISAGRLSLVQAFVTAENIDQLVVAVDGNTLDYLSIDIDQNTYHIWKALDRLKPRVACIEFNSSFPPSVAWEVNYDPARTWNGTNEFGASLKSMELLGRAKGYALVGCDLRGVNAYFVRNDEDLGQFAHPFTAENHYEPPRYPFPLMFAHRGHRSA